MSHSKVGGDNINIGFIGAGKVGFSLGKYFSENNLNVVGYYSKNIESAKDAAIFTNSKHYTSIKEILISSDTIIITTPDLVIEEVWNSIKKLSIKNKIICHCSGSLSSNIFSNIEELNSYGYSIHPIFAICDKYNSHKQLGNAFFTIEGSERYLYYLKDMIEGLGNKVQVISADDKAKYHSAAVFASNHVIGLIKTSIDLLRDCGFNQNDALEAITPLVLNNINNVLDKGIIESLTGPIERNDIETVKAHLECLDYSDRELYKIISKKLVDISKKKNNCKNYNILERLIEE